MTEEAPILGCLHARAVEGYGIRHRHACLLCDRTEAGRWRA
jgi:hypothetical protein